MRKKIQHNSDALKQGAPSLISCFPAIQIDTLELVGRGNVNGFDLKNPISLLQMDTIFFDQTAHDTQSPQGLFSPFPIQRGVGL